MCGSPPALDASSPPAFVELPYYGSMPIPTKQQLAYQGEISALIHFGMATFFHDGDPGCDSKNWHGCDTNGGLTTCNSSDVSSFNPTNLNISAWVESFQALGATSAVLTAKHGCGFLGWQTKTTLPDGSPYRYHVPDHLPVLETFVKETTAAGIGHGFYYSLTNNFYLNVGGHHARGKAGCMPGQACVTQDQFETLALAQVQELWTEYGDLTEVREFPATPIPSAVLCSPAMPGSFCPHCLTCLPACLPACRFGLTAAVVQCATKSAPWSRKRRQRTPSLSTVAASPTHRSAGVAPKAATPSAGMATASGALPTVAGARLAAVVVPPQT